MKLSKKNRKIIASCINNAKTQAVNNYSGYELIATAEILNWLQESILIELFKDHDLKTGEEFIQDCTMMENETC